MLNLKQLLHLNQLEILDLSRNKLQKIPEEISNMTALRVLSVQHNRLENLPLCLAELSTLQILKVAGNPLITPLKRVAEGGEGEALPSLLTDNERDAFLTANIKLYLRKSVVPVRSETESGGESRLDISSLLVMESKLTFLVKRGPARHAATFETWVDWAFPRNPKH